MNQILSVEMPKNGKQKHKTSIHSILMVFAVLAIIFGVGLTSSGVYVCYKNISFDSGETEVATTSSEIEISTERESSSVLYIVVEHDTEIASLSYTVNGEEMQIDIEEGQTSLKEKVILPAGEILLVITAKDVNGMTASRTYNYSVDQVPVISFDQVDTQIQITVESTISIDYIKYYWDDDEDDGETYEINDTKTETLVDVPEGEHTLNVVAVDIEGNEATKFQRIKGNMKPTITVKTNGEIFYISISDDEELTKIGIKLEVDGEVISQTVENVSGTLYEAKLDVEDGDNKLTIVAYDNYGVYNAIIRNFDPNNAEDMALVEDIDENAINVTSSSNSTNSSRTSITNDTGSTEDEDDEEEE